MDPRPLGVDILEWKKAGAFFRSHEGKLGEILSPHEIAFIRSSPDHPRAFAMIFSAKEAAFKALGAPFLGLSGFRDIRVSPKKDFSVRFSGPFKKKSAKDLRVSFKKTRHHVIATCYSKDATCAGN